MEYYSAKKEGNRAICNNDEPWEHYAKWNKPDITYIWLTYLHKPHTKKKI